MYSQTSTLVTAPPAIVPTKSNKRPLELLIACKVVKRLSKHVKFDAVEDVADEEDNEDSLCFPMDSSDKEDSLFFSIDLGKENPKADTPSSLDTLDSGVSSYLEYLGKKPKPQSASGLMFDLPHCNSNHDFDSTEDCLLNDHSTDRDGSPVRVPQQPLRRSARIAAKKNAGTCQVVEHPHPRSAGIAASGIRRSARLAAKTPVDYRL
jgi:hypothetical protein